MSFWWPGLFAKSEQKGQLHRLVPWIRMTGAYRNAETQREDGEVAEIPDADLDFFFLKCIEMIYVKGETQMFCLTFS